MDPSEYRDRILEALRAALADELGIDPPLVNGSLPPDVSALIDRVADLAATRAVQRELDLFGGEKKSSSNGKASEVNPANKLNNLTGAQWLWFTKSVLRTSYPSILGHDIRRHQGGNKPPQLMRELIEFFTKPGELVLDPFAGAGGTALGAHLAGKNSLNIEISQQSIDLYNEVCAAEGIVPHTFLHGDCRTLLATLQDDSVDFIATDPPYSPELEQTMSGAKANAPYGRQNRKSSYKPYSRDPRDLSKAASFEEYFDDMVEIGRALLRVLKNGRYMAMILRDAYQGGRYIPTSAIIGHRYAEIGWVPKGERIWYATGARIRPYGYPNAYVPNIVHQNILIFRKE